MPRWLVVLSYNLTTLTVPGDEYEDSSPSSVLVVFTGPEVDVVGFIVVGVFVFKIFCCSFVVMHKSPGFLSDPVEGESCSCSTSFIAANPGPGPASEEGGLLLILNPITR